MHIHYVEDDKADVLALRHVLRNRRDLTLETSETMDQVCASPRLASLDALLVDVMRPDSVSIENDVTAARAFTHAPLIFLTGLDPASLRERAERAGAVGVLSKSSFNVDLLTECLERAKANRRPVPAREEQEDSADSPQTEFAAQWPMARPSLSSVDTALAVVERGLCASSAGADEDGVGRTDLIRLAQMLRLIGARSFSTLTPCEMSSTMKDLQADLTERAAKLDIFMVIELGPDFSWLALGSRQDAMAGLEALLSAAVYACSPQDWVHVAMRQIDGQARIDISSNQRRLADLGDVFAGGGRVGRDRAFMECAVHLLGLRREQILTYAHPAPTLTAFL